MEKTLREAMGNERWEKIQRSPLKDQIRNCKVSDLTIGELQLLSDFFSKTVLVMTSDFVYGFDDKDEDDFGSEQEWIEGMPIPKRD